MFWRILKKDLKRKKTMNVILLLFVIMCTMFASASVNNIAAVTGGIDSYFDLAGAPDVYVAVQDDAVKEEDIRALSSVSEVKAAHPLMILSSKSFRLRGEQLKNFLNPALIYDWDEVVMTCFDADNEPIGGLEPGTFYATKPFVNDLDIEPGERVELTVGDTVMELEFKGRMKGAYYSNDPSSNPVLIVSHEDYSVIDREEEAHPMTYTELHVTSSDPKEVVDFCQNYDGASADLREDMKYIYLYDMLAAYIMMAISLVLMVTAFVILRFTIGFTISEEFREIGVMKAIGMNNGSIRSIYIVKYFAISVVGAVIGFFGSLPLSGLMLGSVSENMVLTSSGSSLLGIASSAAVVALILLFCYGCTRRVNKLSPIDAVRSGQTGERFGRRSLLSLGRSKLPSTCFMALNDVLSAPKQFAMMTLIFALCVLMIDLMSNFALTLKSEKILFLFNVPESSQAHILDADVIGDCLLGTEEPDELNARVERILADNGIPGKCSSSLILNAEAFHGGERATVSFGQYFGEGSFYPRLEEGSLPEKENEIIVTSSTLEKLDAEIGDTINTTIGGKDYALIITGTYSSFTGGGAFMHNDLDLGTVAWDGTMGVQIIFDGDPDQKTIDENVKKLEDILDTDKVYNNSAMVNQMTSMSSTLSSIKYMMMVLTVVVAAMTVVLMERSFISKEKSEIALMKAVGISGGSIISQHTLRFLIVSLLSCGVALAVLMPISNALMTMVCGFIGDVSGVKCAVDLREILILSPALLIGITTVGSMLTAMYTRTVSASDTASIE